MPAPSDTTISEQTLLRTRLGRFGVMGAGLGALAIGFRVPKQLAGEGLHVDASLALQFLGVLVLLVLSLVCRRRGLTRRTLRVLDWTATLAAAGAYGWMGWQLAGPHGGPHAEVAQLVTLLALNYVVFARAALVPSSTRRTVWVTAACVLALVPVSVRAPLNAFGSPGSSGLFGSIVSICMWGTLTTALAGFISNVIYGLRRDVKEAREFGQYQLLEMIGAGGMGFVYRARHRMLRRDTALKLLPPTRSSAHAISRFEREVQLTARLCHPHTVTIFDYGRTPDGLFYYTMELLDGATLEEIVAATGPMPPARVVRILRQIAGALAEAHAIGLVHRDIKPSNIMLCARGGEWDVSKVLDFGLVRDQVAADLDRHRKPVGLLLGTPHYLSPEAIAHPERVGAASDLYSLGAVAYYMLSGAPPFEADTVVELCSHHLWSEPPPLPRPMAAPALEAIVLGAMAKDPAARPVSAQALADRLEALELSGWSEREAREWWNEHGARVRHDRAGAAASRAGGRRPLEVDLDRISPAGNARA